MAALWPGMVVEEANLTKNIWLLRRALGDSAGASPFIETVPKVGYRWVAPVRRGQEAWPADPPLARSRPPAARRVEAPAAEVPASRTEVPLPASPTEDREVPRSRHPAAVALAGAALAAIIATGWIALARRPQSTDATGGRRAGPVPIRRCVAVVGFHDLSPRGDSAWLSTALGEMIASELAAGERLRIVAAEDVAREKILAPAGTLSKPTLEKLRRSLSADLVVSGAYADGPGHRRASAFGSTSSSRTPRTGEPVGTASATGLAGDLFQLVSSLGVEPPRQARAGGRDIRGAGHRRDDAAAGSRGGPALRRRARAAAARGRTRGEAAAREGDRARTRLRPGSSRPVRRPERPRISVASPVRGEEGRGSGRRDVARRATPPRGPAARGQPRGGQGGGDIPDAVRLLSGQPRVRLARRSGPLRGRTSGGGAARSR